MKTQVLLSALVLSFGSVAFAQDAASLAGVRPGDTIEAVGRDSAGIQGAFWWAFGVPTASQELARYFPHATARAMMPSGRVWEINWAGTYRTQAECERTAVEVRELLARYFPVAATGPAAARVERVTADGTLGFQMSCRANLADFWDADMRIAHLALETELAAGVRSAASLRAGPGL